MTLVTFKGHLSYWMSFEAHHLLNVRISNLVCRLRVRDAYCAGIARFLSARELGFLVLLSSCVTISELLLK